MDDNPTLFDTSIYNVAPPRISDYEDDADYDPHWAQFERRRRERQLDDSPLFKGSKDGQLDDEGGDRTTEGEGDENNGKELREFLGSLEATTSTKQELNLPRNSLILNESGETSNLNKDYARKNPTESEFLGSLEPVAPTVENPNFPRKQKRPYGDGNGYIYIRIATKKGKEYHEAYYHYEFWGNGKRLVKSSKYIPKRLLKKIEQMESEKVPVTEILDVLGVIYW